MKSIILKLTLLTVILGVFGYLLGAQPKELVLAAVVLLPVAFILMALDKFRDAADTVPGANVYSPTELEELDEIVSTTTPAQKLQEIYADTK